MMNRILKRQRARTIALSDELLQEIKKFTDDCVSISSFIRMAIKKELKRLKQDKGVVRDV